MWRPRTSRSNLDSGGSGTIPILIAFLQTFLGATVLCRLREGLQMGQFVEGEYKTQLIAGYVEPSLHRQLVALAREQERTVSFVVRRALLRELERVHNEEEAT